MGTRRLVALNAGRTRRLRRLFDAHGRTVILPLDIIVPVGPFPGASNTGALLDLVAAADVNAVILRWGEARRSAGRLDPTVGLIVRASGSTGMRDRHPHQALLTRVEACAAIAADAVCVDLELGTEREVESLRGVARVCEEAEQLGLAVLVEVDVAGPPGGPDPTPQMVAWGARTAQEAGADLIKIAYPGSASAMAEVCDLVDVPIVAAGGALREPFDALEIAQRALDGGAAGTSFGRNVVGHRSPPDMQRALADLVRRRDTLDAVRARLAALDPSGAR